MLTSLIRRSHHVLKFAVYISTRDLKKNLYSLYIIYLHAFDQGRIKSLERQNLELEAERLQLQVLAGFNIWIHDLN